MRRDGSLGDREQILGRDVHVIALHVDLVRALHVLVENILGHGDQAWMRDPGAVVPGLHFAQFILAHFGQRLFVGRRIVLDGNLRRHSAHGVGAAAVARAGSARPRRSQEMLRHGDFGAVRENEVGALAEFLDEAENVIPAAAVQAGGVLAQFVHDFVHLECREDRFDQHRRANRAARDSQRNPARN